MRAGGRLFSGVAVALALVGCSEDGDASVGTAGSTGADRPSAALQIIEFMRVAVDGDSSFDVSIGDAGVYTIYYEFRSEIDGEAFDAAAEPPEDLTLAVSNSTGDELRVRTSREVTEYTYDPFEGVSVGTVEIGQAGRYVITVTGGEEPFVLALGRGTL